MTWVIKRVRRDDPDEWSAVITNGTRRVFVFDATEEAVTVKAQAKCDEFNERES